MKPNIVSNILAVVSFLLLSTGIISYGIAVHTNQILIEGNAKALKEIHDSMDMRTIMLQEIIDKIDKIN